MIIGKIPRIVNQTSHPPILIKRKLTNSHVSMGESTEPFGCGGVACEVKGSAFGAGHTIRIAYVIPYV